MLFPPLPRVGPLPEPPQVSIACFRTGRNAVKPNLGVGIVLMRFSAVVTICNPNSKAISSKTSLASFVRLMKGVTAESNRKMWTSVTMKLRSLTMFLSISERYFLARSKRDIPACIVDMLPEASMKMMSLPLVNLVVVRDSTSPRSLERAPMILQKLR